MISATSNIINLNSLLDLSARLYDSDVGIFFLNSTLLSLMGKLRITKASIFTFNDDECKFNLSLTKGNFNITPNFNFIPNNFFEINELDIHLKNKGVRYIIPIYIQLKPYALIYLGNSLIEHSLTEEEIKYINLVSNIAANAITNAQNISSFKAAKENAERHNQLLTTLFEIGRDFSSFFNREQILRTLNLNLMGQLTVSRFAVFLTNENNEYIPLINRFTGTFSSDILNKICISEIAERICMEGLNEDEIKFVNDNEIIISAPMKVQGVHKGLMIIGRKMNRGEFTDHDILFIEALGNTAIAALENERLFREELEKKRLESELGIALEIQRNLLPKKAPELKLFDIYGVSIPSRHVGGDYFDFIQIDESRYLVAVADVSGKGIPASLIMANMQAALHLLTRTVPSLEDIILQTNFLLYHNTSPDKFVTGFFCIIDDVSGTIEYINAGHNPPLFLQHNDLNHLKEGGLILGFLENPPKYHSAKIENDENYTIVSFTDGVNEARNAYGEEYSDERLENLSLNNSDMSAELLTNKIIDDVKDFVGNSFQYDDITLVVIKKK